MLQGVEQPSVSVVGYGGRVLADEEYSLVRMLDRGAAWIGMWAAAWTLDTSALRSFKRDMLFSQNCKR